MVRTWQKLVVGLENERKFEAHEVRSFVHHHHHSRYKWTLKTKFLIFLFQSDNKNQSA